MHKLKFSLPEGSDLKLVVCGSEVEILVVYNEAHVLDMCYYLLGQEVTLRRGILGTSFIRNEVNETRAITSDYVSEIRARLADRKERDKAKDEALKHLDTIGGESSTFRDIFQASFDRTTARLMASPATVSRGFGVSDVAAIPFSRDFVINLTSTYEN